jgi:hypothetical protein
MRLNRNDLIRYNMASVHLPWFLNGDLHQFSRPALYRQEFCQGAGLSGTTSSVLILDYNIPYVCVIKCWTLSKQCHDGIWKLFEDGKEVCPSNGRGLLVSLPRCKHNNDDS